MIESKLHHPYLRPQLRLIPHHLFENFTLPSRNIRPDVMPLSSTATATMTPLTSTPASKLSTQRTYRCGRCANRKFRTTTDLALHILGKHGHTEHRPGVIKHASRSPDDACSVTFMSPPLPVSAAVATAKAVAAAAAKNAIVVTSSSSSQFPSASSSSSSPVSSSVVAHPRPLKASKRPRIKPGMSKRAARIRTHTTVSSHGLVHPMLSVYAAPPSPATAAVKQAKKRSNHVSSLPPTRRTKQDDGESIGPIAQDVYVRKCLDGRIPVVPKHPHQPTKTINFAQGLF